MTVRDVLMIGHPALREPAADVPVAEIATGPIQTLIDDLVEVARDEIHVASVETWEEFDRHHRDAFVERITAFVERVGS